MKKSIFKAVKVRQVVSSDATRQVAVELIDDDRQEMTLSLSPPARVALLQHLMSRPSTAKSGQPRQSGVLLKAQGFALFARQGDVVLEVQIGPEQSVHIALPVPQAEVLLELLRSYRAGGRTTFH